MPRDAATNPAPDAGDTPPAASADPVWASADGPFRGCSIAGALDVFGDRWSLLAIREIASGRRRFTQIATTTGAPRDVLTARLRKLEGEGVLRRERYQERPPRFEYALTEAGLELVPVLLALREWGDRHLAGQPPNIVVHSCGARLVPETHCQACGGHVTPADLAIEEHPTAA